MRDRVITLDFLENALIVNWDESTRKVESSSVSVNLEETGLSECEKKKFKKYMQ